MPKIYKGTTGTQKKAILKLGNLVPQSNISANMTIFSAANPVGADIIVDHLIIDVTGASGVANGAITCGKGANVAVAQNSAVFVNAAPCANATITTISSIKRGDTGSARVNSTEVIAAKITGDANANAATLAGSVYIDFFYA